MTFFPPIEPLRPDDLDSRRQAAVNRVSRRRNRRLAGAVAAAVAVGAGLIVALVPGGRSAHVVSVGPGPTTTARLLPYIVGPGPVLTVPSRTTTTTSPAVTSGVVTGPGGQPVAGAYVIGLTSLKVARTDSTGHFAMACTGEKLVAATWLLPVIRSTDTGAVTYGVDTTRYGDAPTTPGLGYVFSGGSTTAAGATAETCNGRPIGFRLPAGAGLVIQWRTLLRPLPTGTGSTLYDPTAQTTPGVPIDNIYIPGLGDRAAVLLSPTNAGQQIIEQLGPGAIRIDATGAGFTCAGATPDATVVLPAGKTVTVQCRLL